MRIILTILFLITLAGCASKAKKITRTQAQIECIKELLEAGMSSIEARRACLGIYRRD